MSQTTRRPQSDEAELAPETRQREASHPDSSVWVSASAGSGKTRVLTDRVLRLLLDGVPPQKILCLTYTKAAAAEMSNRIAGRLSHWASCDENALRESLDKLQDKKPTDQQLITARRLFARVLSCPGGMRIRTIHAFGQEVLRRFPIEAGLPPHFAVIEENDAREMQDDALNSMMRDISAAPNTPLDRALKFFACNIGERGFAGLRSVLHDRGRLNDAVTKEGSFEKLIARIRALLSLEPDETAENIIALAVQNIPRAEIKKAAQGLLEGSESFAKRGRGILVCLEKTLVNQEDFETYARFFLTAEGDFFSSYINKDLMSTYPDLDTICRREAARLQGINERLEAAEIAETTEAILRLGWELITRYETRKQAQAVLDYDDLIIRTCELLRRPGIAPWVLYKLDGGLDHILVDEAQDTSRVQWDIVAALADEFFAGLSARDGKNRTLFVVGDEKQSIFSFQRADPEAFTAMRNHFQRRIEDAGKFLDDVPLHTSFRSAPAILKTVDKVFANEEARKGVSENLVQHQAAPVPAGAPEKIGHVEVWPILSGSERNKDDEDVWQLPFEYEEEHDPQVELAALIAGKIKNWLSKGEILSGLNRPIVPGDIMILLRRRGRFADLMVRALKKLDVPVTGVDRMILTKPLVVMDLLALIQFALLPEDDLNLATVLRGPLLNLGEEQLMQLAMQRDGSLWQSLMAKSSAQPFAAAHAYLESWLNAADFITPFAMLTRILNEACPGSTISGRRAIWSRLGPDALDPIEELLNAAQSFGHRHTPSLQTFLHWLTAGETEIKREMDYGGGQVKIMTVHAAKGLEAPIVFLPDAASMPRTQDVRSFVWDDNGLPLYLARKPSAGAARRLWEQERQKQMEEYRRLFYVALTRAANRLYIAGWEKEKPKDGKKKPQKEQSWYNLAAEALKPLHEPAAVANDMPLPLVAFTDPVLREPLPVPSEEKSTDKPTKLPDWARHTALPEAASPRSIAPSHIAALPAAATPDSAFARGRIIHRLLQSLPDLDMAQRPEAAARFLANPRHNLKSEQQKEIQKETLDLLSHPDYAPLFDPNSRAEVPLAGYSGKQPVAGQVDRLCLRGDEVWIVDYKTNRPPPQKVTDVAPAYHAQMAAYRDVLTAIYPGKKIRCFLLWTYGPSLMELPR
ncbi:MAG: double-strand break repair helicase AddA [Alphaproteobacteria bacterium]|nr:double-strand break repair helicase AddA [Alphaproteobacteria bacterium]